MKRFAPLLALAALVAAPTWSAAQSASSGWIGISFNVVTTGTPSGVIHRVVRIAEVSRGSPARDAGVRPGDIIVRINHIAGPDSLNNLGRYLHLEPGDSVQMVVTRAGRQYTLPMAAAARPDPPVVVSTNISMRFEPDSMVESFARAMDSMRLRLVEAQAAGVTVLSRDGAGNLALVRPDSFATVLGENRGRWQVAGVSSGDWPVLELREPFEARLFQGDRFDSLVLEMDSLNQRIRQVRSVRADRVRELNRRNRSTASDRELQELERALEQLATSSIRLRKAMEDDARQSAGDAYTIVGVPRAARVSDAPQPSDVRVFRPLAPYLLGQNRAIGAEIIDLTPGLAEYFNVENGVLVVEVPARTPAAVAGIQAGDVISKIDQVTIRSVDDLRLALSRAGSEIPLTLIREGTSRQVLLRR